MLGCGRVAAGPAPKHGARRPRRVASPGAAATSARWRGVSTPSRFHAIEARRSHCLISTQEQTQDELGLVLRNRKDGHVCIVSVCPELCPALYEAARRGFMVPGHRIASIDGQWLGAGNELEFDVVATMASSRDHSDAVAAVRYSTTVPRRRRFTQVNDIRTRARRRTTCGERSGSSACSSRSRRPSRFRAGATTSRCPGGSTPCS